MERCGGGWEVVGEMERREGCREGGRGMEKGVMKGGSQTVGEMVGRKGYRGEGERWRRG